MAESTKKISKPSLFWTVTEAGRAITELGLSIPFRSKYKNTVQGDGHPIMVLPGFMASERSTYPLRKFLHNMGYTVYDWGLGRNLGKPSYQEELLERIDAMYEKHGERISLVGWSLGGVFARELAKKRPQIIRQVITLGSPFRSVIKKNNATWMYSYVTGGDKVEDIDPVLLKEIPNPAPVPTTAIYSKEDGVVPWQYCMEAVEDATHQNIQVRGSHLGLGHNLLVLRIIADRLQYAEETWQHFQSSNKMKDILMYPSL